VAKSVVSTALSELEKEIARLAGSGLCNCEVSQRLSLSQYTVKNNLVRVYEKLGISTTSNSFSTLLSNNKTLNLRRPTPPSDFAEREFQRLTGQQGHLWAVRAYTSRSNPTFHQRSVCTEFGQLTLRSDWV
jgi:DNA-binding CsgD family transcriptional regulator